MSASPWTASRHPHRVVIPVVRLDAALPCFDAPAGVRRALALALAVDTIRAASSARLPLEVLVAAPDPEVRTRAAELGVRALPGCEGDTDEEITRSANLAAKREGLEGATAVLASRLPCLLPNELDAALMSRADRRAEYRDLGGRVATLRADTNGWPAADPPHLHEPIERVLRRLKTRQFLPGLACQISTIDSLRIATYIGVGPATEAARSRTSRSRTPEPSTLSSPEPPMTPAEPTPEEVAAVIAVLIATSIAPAPPVTSASAWTTGGRHRRPHPRPAAGGWLASTRQYA